MPSACPPVSVTLASVLKSQGYQTAAFIGSVFLEREMGLDRGFDFYDSPFRFEAFSPMSGSMFFGGAGRIPYGVRDRRDGALVIGAANRWLNAHPDQPDFRIHPPVRFAQALSSRRLRCGDPVRRSSVGRAQTVAGKSWMVGQVAGRGVLRSRRRTGRTRRGEPRLFHLREHASCSAAGALAVRIAEVSRAYRAACGVDRCGADSARFSAHPNAAVVRG